MHKPKQYNSNNIPETGCGCFPIATLAAITALAGCCCCGIPASCYTYVHQQPKPQPSESQHQNKQQQDKTYTTIDKKIQEEKFK